MEDENSNPPEWCTGTVVADQSVDEKHWLQTRKRYLTGSVVAQALDESKWHDPDPKTGRPGRTRERLLSEKLLDGAFEQNERMWWGKELEGEIMKRMGSAPDSLTEGWSVRRSGKLIEDRDCDKFASTPDGWASVPGFPKEMPMDLKISGFGWRATKNNPDNRAPIDYELQCQAHMAVTGAEHCALVQFAGNCITWAKVFDRKDGVIRVLRLEAVRFMKDLHERQSEIGAMVDEIDTILEGGEA